MQIHFTWIDVPFLPGIAYLKKFKQPSALTCEELNEQKQSMTLTLNSSLTLVLLYNLHA